jgi:hypothetical protein
MLNPNPNKNSDIVLKTTQITAYRRINNFLELRKWKQAFSVQPHPQYRYRYSAENPSPERNPGKNTIFKMFNLNT